MVSRKIVLIERKEGVATVILNDPERRNPLSPEMNAALKSAYEELRDDDSVSVVITTGAGDVAWCAGMYGPSLVAGRDANLRGERPGRGGSSYEALLNYPKVTIAAVNGYCLGAATILLNVHDLAIASEERARFGLPEIFRDHPTGPIAATLTKAVPPKWFFDMALTGENWDARTAQKVGLISRVAPHAQLREAAFQWAKEIASLDRITLEYIKRQYHGAMNELNYTRAVELCMFIQAEHDRVNPKAMGGWSEFFGKTGRRATSMIKWGFKE